jgi:GNAT superfamily N-acetyltransferase
MTIRLVRTDASNADFVEMVKLLDADLAIRDGDEHAFYGAINQKSMTIIKQAVVAYHDGQAVGCGAIKPFSDEAMEVKRMFTLPAYRGKGVASLVVAELEQWSRELSFVKTVLETGKKQPEAIALYTKLGYKGIPNYGQYVGVENSVCMGKELN